MAKKEVIHSSSTGSMQLPGPGRWFRGAIPSLRELLPRGGHSVLGSDPVERSWGTEPNHDEEQIRPAGLKNIEFAPQPYVKLPGTARAIIRREILTFNVNKNPTRVHLWPSLICSQFQVDRAA